MFKFSTNNGFIRVDVSIDDLQVYDFVKRYLGIDDTANSNDMQDWQIEAFNQSYPIVNTAPFNECKGEYGERMLEYHEDDCLIRYNCANKSVIKFISSRHIQIYNSAKEGLFIDTYRAVRQILIQDLIRRGGIVVHSSSICGNGGGYLFVGSKGAGKTTALFQYLCSNLTDICYGSNERNILIEKDGALWVYGWLGVAFVGVGTIKSTIGLEKLFNMHEKAGGTAFWLSEHKLIDSALIESLIALGDDAYKIKEKIWITADEIAYLTNRRICNRFRLDGIVFPQFIQNATQKIDVAIDMTDDELSTQVITDLNFFNDWLNVRCGGNTIDERINIFKALKQTPKIRISGSNLVTNLNYQFNKGVAEL